MKKCNFCYPNYTRKAISFTIDDGVLSLDEKFINIVRPARIKGTFNLIGDTRMGALTPEQYREFYRGFEIANHCKMHPKVILPTDNFVISDEPFDNKTADITKIYKTETEGLYYKWYNTLWGYVATTDTYIKLIDQGKAELDAIFGAENITAFVWPYCYQSDERLHKHLAAAGYRSVRRTGMAGFELPADKMDWCYNATHKTLLERAKEFDALEDDGELKFFCFGVHSHDFERDKMWWVLEEFAHIYGNRPSDYWYATVGEIFEYDDAIKSIRIGETIISNPTDLKVYFTLDGERKCLDAHSEVKI